MPLLQSLRHKEQPVKSGLLSYGGLHIGSYNVMTQMNVVEYMDLIRGSVKKNELQRPRVRSSKSIYANLKEDLKAGCIIPPIVRSLYSQYDGSVLSSQAPKLTPGARP